MNQAASVREESCRRPMHRAHAVFPLSAAQERLWYTDQLSGPSDQYNIPLTLEISGRVNVPALCHAFQRVVARHGTLRAAFLASDNKPTQRICAANELGAWLRIVDLRGVGAAAESLVARMQRVESAMAFSLDQAPLIRVNLLQLEDARHVLFISTHHIVSDGASLQILLKEIVGAYERYSRGSVDDLMPLKRQYADYASWESRYLQSAEASHSANFWHEYLRGAPANVGLPADRRVGSSAPYVGNECRRSLGEELTGALRLFARRTRCSEFMVLLATFAAVIHRYTRQRDLVIATPSEGRHQPEWSDLIGFFVNLLPIRVGVRGPESFAALVQATRDAALQALEHGRYPFLNMLKDARRSRTAQQTPYCDVVFQKTDTPRRTLMRALPEWRDISLPCNTAKFNMALTAVDDGRSIDLVCEYDSRLYGETRIEGLLRHYVNFLSAALAEPSVDIGRCRMLDASEHRHLIRSWNRTSASFPVTDVFSLFEAQAQATPDRVALVQDDQHLTYAELLIEARSLARRLSQSDDDSELVGVMLDRCMQFVIAVLAISQTGKGYVPIDVSLPAERIDYILQDANITQLLTSEDLAGRIDIGPAAKSKVHIEVLRDPSRCGPAVAEEGGGASAGVKYGYCTQAYCLYTSGSSGKPKGVVISQAALCNYLWFARERYGLADSTMALYTSLSSDLTVTSVLGPLISGGTVRLYAQGNDQLRHIVAEDLVDVIKATPAHLAQLNRGVRPPRRLRALIVGGERLLPSLADRAQDVLGHDLKVYNEYGPTEATVGCVVYEYRGNEQDLDSVPIGRPIGNMEAYLLDEQLNPVPRGVEGELYLSGVGLANGYHNARALSAAGFVPNPFRPGQRMYRTGDIGVLHFDDEMEFCRRNDRQVKVRGYRTELGEIEAVLAQHEAIENCAVELRGAGAGSAEASAEPERIVAWYVSKTALSPTRLRAHLAQKLPGYMIPAAFVHLDTPPLTSSGKLDRKRLPAVDRTRPQLQTRYVPPGNEAEAQLALIWSRLLYIDEPGVQDDFFELGGHSLLAFELIGAIAEHFHVDVEMNSIIPHPTIAAQVALIEAAGTGQNVERLPQIVPDPAHASEPFPLTETQEAYWVGRRALFGIGSVANHGYLEITCRRLHIQRLEQAWAKLVRRHGMLRAVIHEDATQRILPEVHCAPCPIVDLRGLPADCVDAVMARIRERMSHEIRPLDRWPLFDIRVVLRNDDEAVLLLSLEVMHVDESSFLILSDELGQLYQRPDIVGTPPAVSFRDYVMGQKSLVPAALREKSWNYWSQIIDHLPPGPELPLAVSLKEVASPQFTRRSFQVSPDRWQAVQRFAKRIKVTPSGLLLAAYAEVLARWSNSKRFTITIPVYNRLPLHPEINHVIGVFTAINLLVIEAAPGSDFATRAVQIQKRLWLDLDHRLISGVALHREIGRRRGASSEATFPYVFTNVIGLGRSGKTSGIQSIGTITYGISQTPQVLLDCQLSEEAGGLLACWDSVDAAFPPGMMDEMFLAFGQTVHALGADAAGLDGADPAGLEGALEEAMLPSRLRAARGLVNETSGAVRENTVPEEFAAQLADYRENVALLDNLRTILHGELHEMARVVAARVSELGSGPDELVAVCMEKGCQQIAAVFGALYAGSAYLPVDPNWPRDRMEQHLRHGKVRVLLTQAHLIERLSGLDVQAVPVDSLLGTVYPSKLGPARGSSRDLCYVLHTSGSTGQPKGVMVEHRSVVNRMADIAHRFALGPQDRAIAITSLQHDLSVFDMFGLLLSGGGLVIPHQDHQLDPAHWARLMVDRAVTVWNSVPAFMDILVSYLEANPQASPAGLRLILLSGDRIPPQLYFRIRKVLPRAAVVSLGGPTEITVWDIGYPVEHLATNAKRIPYGYPLANSQCHILDDELRDCPTWVTGELYSSGIGLARGYWADTALTQSAFIPHPRTGVRMYRTGDLARYLPDGSIDIFGRKDFQVKVNGYRVECGEIEALLSEHPLVAQAVVTTSAHAAGGQGLIAYVVPRGLRPGPRSSDATARKLEHLQFRSRQPGIRRFGEDVESIRLADRRRPDARQIDLYLGRRSFRRFQPRPVGRADLAAVLDSITQLRIDDAPFPKYRYGSAGNLYPVQTYLHVKPGTVAGVPAGVYYHHPIENSLVLMAALDELPADSVGLENRQILSQAAFVLFLIADLDAIRPVYGDTALRYCAIEAGLMTQVLETSCAGTQLGLTQIGGIQIDTIRESFRLGSSHELLHAMLGGVVERGGDELAHYKKEIADWASPSTSTPDVGAELQKYLQSKLSRAVVPQRFILLDSLPLNASGKVDRAALPAPQSVQSSTAPEYREPQNAIQKMLAEIWQQVLEKPRVGIDDNFFDVGGNSLLLIKANQRIVESTRVEVPITEMFSYPSIRLLAEFLQARGKPRKAGGAQSERLERRKQRRRH